MSIVNFLVEPDRILVACDTLANNLVGNQHGTFGAKVLFLHSSGLLLAGRGDALQLQAVHMVVGFAAVANYDDVEQIIEEALAKTTPALRKFEPADAPEMPCEFLIAGWSPSRQRMVSQFRTRSSRDAEWSKPRQMPWCIAPIVLPYREGAAGLSTPEGMMAIARRQVAMQRPRPSVKGEDCIAVGGDLHLVTHTRTKTTYENFGPILAPLDAEELAGLGIDPAHWAELVAHPTPVG